jgi:tetratricopeptide (TPR) repeat protein
MLSLSSFYSTLKPLSSPAKPLVTVAAFLSCAIAIAPLTGCEQGFQRAERGESRWNGRQALEHHDWETAVAQYSKLIEMNPRHGENYQSRAEAYVGQRDFDKALRDYRTATNLGFNSDLQIGCIELTRGNFADAAASLQSGLDRRPTDPMLGDAMYCGLAYKMEGNTQAAEKVLDRAADNYAQDSYVMAHKNDKNAQKYIWERWPYPGVQFVRGKMTADQLLATVKDDDYNFAEAHCVVGLNHLANKQKSEAIKEFEYVRLQAQPYRFVAQLSTGLVEQLRQRKNDASTENQANDPANEHTIDQGTASAPRE